MQTNKPNFGWVDAYLARPEIRAAHDVAVQSLVAMALLGQDEGAARDCFRIAAEFRARGSIMPPPLEFAVQVALNAGAKGVRPDQALARTVGKQGRPRTSQRAIVVAAAYQNELWRADREGRVLSTADAEAIVAERLHMSSERVNQIVDQYVRRGKVNRLLARADKLLEK